MSKITIQIESEVDVPNGTRVINEVGEFITLARKKAGIVSILTCLKTKLSEIDLINENSWIEFTIAEIRKLAEFAK